jgi:hypothetical protein
MQVDECRAAAGVAHPFHQLTKVGSCIGGQLVAGMAQVMEMNVKSSRGEPPDSAATTAEPALQILVGNAMLNAPCLKLRDINRIGQSPRRLVGKI